jgi:hypothetical protein
MTPTYKWRVVRHRANPGQTFASAHRRPHRSSRSKNDGIQPSGIPATARQGHVIGASHDTWNAKGRKPHGLCTVQRWICKGVESHKSTNEPRCRFQRRIKFDSPARREAFAPLRSREIRVSAKSHEAQTRAKHGIRRTARSIVKSRQPESCAQLQTTRLLLLRDGDCGEECLLGRRCIRRSRFKRISPRKRCRKASLQYCPVSRARASASSIIRKPALSRSGSTLLLHRPALRSRQVTLG